MQTGSFVPFTPLGYHAAQGAAMRRRIPHTVLKQMARTLSPEDRDELAIPSYLHPNPLLRWMAWRRIEVITRHFQDACRTRPGGAGPIVMDFGCGTGVLFDEVSHLAQRIYGVDPVLHAAQLLVDTWGLDKVTLLTPEQAAGGVPEKSVDIILAAEVLEHIDPLQGAITFLKSRLKREGTLLVSLPTEGALYRIGRRLAGFRGHYHHGNAASVDCEIVAAGFTQERLEKIPGPGPLAIYWVVDYRLNEAAAQHFGG